MAVIPSQTMINRLGRMVAATVDPKLSDDDLADALVMYALTDSSGVIPGESAWVESYDLNGAAVEAWGWKKAKASAMVSFDADGSKFSISELQANIQERINFYTGLRAVGTITTGVAV